MYFLKPDIYPSNHVPSFSFRGNHVKGRQWRLEFSWPVHTLWPIFFVTNADACGIARWAFEDRLSPRMFFPLCAELNEPYRNWTYNLGLIQLSSLKLPFGNLCSAVMRLRLWFHSFNKQSQHHTNGSREHREAEDKVFALKGLGWVHKSRMSGQKWWPLGEWGWANQEFTKANQEKGERYILPGEHQGPLKDGQFSQESERG